MKNLFIILSLILVVSISFAHAQTDTVKTDKVYMLDGSTIDGKVKIVKSDIVVFTEKETGVDYELNKSEIKVIELSTGKILVFNNTVTKEQAKNKVYNSNKNVEKQYVAPTATDTPVTTVKNTTPQFSLGGLLFLSLESWNDLQTTESKMGFGLSGDLFAGVIFNDMYIGVGPHLGGNFWTLSYQGYSETTNLTDAGFSIVGAWDGFYFTFGGGSSSISFSGDAGNYDGPDGIGYTRFGLGWFDGYAIGMSFVNYDKDKAKNLNRIEFNVGWAF